MKKLLIRLVLLGIFLSGVSLASADEWNIYTNPDDVTALTQEGDYLWWTGAFGIMQYNRLDGSQRVYTALDFRDGFRFTAVAVAPDGTKWFGTLYGKVLRLNDSGWTVFTDINPNWSTTPDKVSTIIFDRDGDVWFGTLHGAFRFDGRNWTHYGLKEGFSDKEVTSALLDRNGNLWFGATDGLYRFDGNAWGKYVVSEDGVHHRGVTSLAGDTSGVLWIGTSIGLASFDGASWKYYPSLGEKWSENTITSLSLGPDGALWLGTQAGLFMLKGEEKKVYTMENNTLPDNRVVAVFTDSDGVVWVSTGDPWGETTTKLGLARFDGSEWKTIRTRGVGGNSVNSILIDDDNKKWFAATNAGSLSVFDGAAWKQYTEADGIVSRYVNAVASDSSGRKWFTAYGGIFRYDGGSWTNFTPEKGFPGTVAYMEAFDRDSVGWFLLDTGLYSFDGTTWTAWSDSVRTYGDLDGNGVVNIICITVDRNNVKWFGTTHDGISSFDGLTWNHYSKEDGLSGNCVRCISADRDNVLWIGTGMLSYDNGISSFDGNTWTNHRYDRHIIDGEITGVAVDESNKKWFVSYTKRDVFSFDGATWKTYSPPWGVGYGGYNCIAIDRDGIKWLGSRKTGAVTFRESDRTETAATASDASPKGFAILGNRPNPFNPSTTIEFILPSAGMTELAIYGVSGQKVRTLFSGRLSAGRHSLIWDGRDDAGKPVSSGVYISQVRMGGRTVSGRMALVK